MIFRRKRDAAIQLAEFSKMSCKSAYERFKENLDEHNISKETFYSEFFAFSIFTIDYSCTCYFKDEKKNSKLLRLFYTELFTTLNDKAMYEQLSAVVNVFGTCVRESKDTGDIIQKITFKFAERLSSEVDLIIAMKVGLEFTEIGSMVKVILKDNKLIK